MRTVKKILVVIGIVFAMAGCQAVTGRTTGRNVDDATVTSSVKTKLAGDKLSTLTRVDVDTNNGTVALNGVVESAEERARAQELASQVSGVNKVVNNLQVQKK